METKQIIVIRRDLKMRRGKEIAQGAHSSMSFLTKGSEVWFDILDGPYVRPNWSFEFTEEVKDWLANSFAKITLYVNSEQELDDLYTKCKDSGLEVHMITDSGRTEFHGVATKTCLAIGPHQLSKFEGITENLPLY